MNTYVVEVCNDKSSPGSSIEIDEYRFRLEAIVGKLKMEGYEICDSRSDGEVCRICLASCRKIKMFDLRDGGLEKAYNDVTGFTISADDRLPLVLCWECRARVLAAARCQIRARTAYAVLNNLLQIHGAITISGLLSIDRYENELASQLSKKYIKPNEYNCLINEQIEYISDIMSDDNEDLLDENKLTPQQSKKCDMSDDNEDVLDDKQLASQLSKKGIKPNEYNCLIKEQIEYISDIMSDDNEDQLVENTDKDIVKDDFDNKDTSYLYTDNDIEISIDISDTENENETDTHMEEDINENSPVVVNEVEKNNANDVEGPLVEKVTKNINLKKRTCPTDFTVTSITKEEEVTEWQSHNDPNGTYKCDICHHGFPTQRIFTKHVLQHTEKYGMFECEICKIRKPTKSRIRSHVRYFHGKVYKCNKCSYFTVDILLAKLHHKQHKIECQICADNFPSKELYSKHKCDMPCEFCGKTFTTRLGVVFHQKAHHFDKRKPLSGPHCATCDVTFATQDAHDTHLTRSARHNDQSYANRPEYLVNFTITKLTKEQEIAELQSRESQGQYKCAECHRGYITRDCYEGHILRHTVKYGTFECEICKIRKRTKKLLLKHTKLCHGRKYSCNKCPFVTKTRSAAKNHHEHAHGADVNYKCPHCLKLFSHRSTYLGHLRISHPCEWPCEYCGCTYRSEQGKIFHQNTTHLFDEYETPLSGPHCASCNVTFATEKAHFVHLTKSSRHKDDSSKISNNFQIANKLQIKSSAGKLRRRTERRPGTGLPDFISVTCEQCDQTFPTIRAYKYHFKKDHPGLARTQHHPERPRDYIYTCEHCGNTYSSQAVLNDHSTIHSGVQFECNDCGKKFKRKTRLDYHMKIHSENRQTWKCGVCGKHFLSPSNRLRHMKYHVNLKPYECEACGKRFVYPSELRVHIDHVHNDVPWPKRDRRKTLPEGRCNVNMYNNKID